jgi:hypothetical protein
MGVVVRSRTNRIEVLLMNRPALSGVIVLEAAKAQLVSRRLPAWNGLVDSLPDNDIPTASSVCVKPPTADATSAWWLSWN